MIKTHTIQRVSNENMLMKAVTVLQGEADFPEKELNLDPGYMNNKCDRARVCVRERE